jgi:hypothetical protein
MHLWLDVERGKAAATYQERVFHHEFFHLIDYLVAGPGLRDTDWAALNPPDFRYGPGGSRMQDSRTNPFAATRSIPGFLTLYGTAAVEEDKAELFSFLFTDDAFLAERSTADPVVRAKQARLKELLQRFCPALSGAYFGRLAAHQAAVGAVRAGEWVLIVLGGSGHARVRAWALTEFVRGR